MQPARMLIITGVVFLVVGLLWLMGDKLGLGRLPGDVVLKRDKLTVYIPIVSSLVLSVVLTVILNLIGRR